ncbi:hypothetical protein LWI28_020336 [Acer negundo]|uniref:SANTA domain-containing protein n=1 Tax=Acer negundo TaxID=4023 RepID=A0AAD5IF63_ACENE|nr:hypothetical protein LWI28_020336 [Acer negundo]KAK4838651.1 hypothetical protein QYF36_015369 [Acer negundo]
MNTSASAHASRQRCNSSNNHDDNNSSSYFQSTVCLYDWWLIKSDEIFEGKRLAVAGRSSTELKPIRIFTSAPIVKKHDIFTLETADGICIILKGFINKSRTKENGFSDEVFRHFLIGFPPYWEAYKEKCLEEEFTTGPGLVPIRDTNGSATGHGAVAGMKNANPNTTPINYEVNGKNKHNVEDINESSENVSEKVTTDASKGSDSQNLAAEDNNFEKAKDHASENLLLSMSCDVNVVSLPKDNLALPVEFSSYEFSGNCVDDTMNFPTVESDINVNGFAPTKVHTNALNVLPSNSGSRKTRSQNKRSGFTGSVKCKNKEFMPDTSKRSDGENLKSCSSSTAIHSLKKMDILEAARSQSINKMVRNMSENSDGKKKERHAKGNKMGSATLVSDGTSSLEGMNIFDFCDDELQQPTHDTVVKDNSKQGKDHRKESQAGTPRQKPNNSDRSRNEFSDTNHQYESETAVGEREATAKGDSSKMKARRKIKFDTQASPLTRGRKENIVSPESMSCKRSRSGRLLLPSLDFWCNQIAVYDADRKITGIQVATPSKGSKSEPPKKRSR